KIQLSAEENQEQTDSGNFVNVIAHWLRRITDLILQWTAFLVVATLEIFSAYLCVPLRLCGEIALLYFTAETQRNAEIRRVEFLRHHRFSRTVAGRADARYYSCRVTGRNPSAERAEPT